MGVLIPAYNPVESLPSLVETLIRLGFRNIVIVNDGSGPEHEHIFTRLEEMDHCRVLRHAVNLGKGRSLKTGLNHIYLHLRDLAGVVTMDADGQHLPEDVLKVSKNFLNNPEKLVIGVRKFGQGTPLRSLIGNTLTRYIFGFMVGKKLSDTQSGLRCIPMSRIPSLMRLDGERYEYEMNMLVWTRTAQIDIAEEGIKTIYIDNNRSSNFNPLIDSMKIYFLLLRFSFSSLFASFIDFIVFAVTFSITGNILTSIIFARLVAGNVNFFVNKKIVFHSKEAIATTIVKYYILLVVLGSLAYLSINTLAGYGANVLAAKILTETVLFFTSFSIQRDFIFARHKKEAATWGNAD
jgi:glycosyltransferase involved in cell wall biosynthesis